MTNTHRDNNTMSYDAHGGGHRGELRLYCPRTEEKFSKMTSGAYGPGFAFGKSLVRLHNFLRSCDSILGNLPRGQFYLPTPVAFTLFIPNNRTQ